MLLGTATALCFLWLFGFSYGFSLHLAEKGGMSFLQFVLSLLAFFRPLDLFNITPSLARSSSHAHRPRDSFIRNGK